MNNPIDFLNLIKNPKEFVINYAQKNPNPMLDNLIKMAESNNQQGIENFARNIFKEQGKNYDDIASLLNK